FCLSDRTSPSSTSRVRAPTYTGFPPLASGPPATSPRPLHCAAFPRRLSLRSALLSPGGAAALRLAGPWSGAGLLPHLERLDDVVDTNVVVAEADTALEALANLGRIVLEPAQRVDREAARDHHAVADQAGLAVAGDRAGADDAAGHVADSRHPEDLPDLSRAQLDFLEDGLQHAPERG